MILGQLRIGARPTTYAALMMMMVMVMMVMVMTMTVMVMITMMLLMMVMTMMLLMMMVILVLSNIYMPTKIMLLVFDNDEVMNRHIIIHDFI